MAVLDQDVEIEKKDPLPGEATQGVIAQTGVLAMIFIGSVQTGERFSSRSTRPDLLEMVALLVAVVGIHVLILVSGMAIARLLRFDRGDQISVGFAGSQKTLMVGLQVSIELGFNIIPMVAYHISQLLIDTLVADRLRASPPGDT